MKPLKSFERYNKRSLIFYVIYFVKTFIDAQSFDTKITNTQPKGKINLKAVSLMKYTLKITFFKKIKKVQEASLQNISLKFVSYMKNDETPELIEYLCNLNKKQVQTGNFR